MFEIYSRNVKTGEEKYERTRNTLQETIEWIYNLYGIDEDTDHLGEYFYFYKEAK